MWSRALGFAALLLWPASSFAQVAFDAANSATGAGVSSLSFSLTTSGANRALAGGTAVYSNATTGALPNGMTYNGVALTDLGTASQNGSSGPLRSNQGYLVAPATGANTFQCNFTNTSNFDLGCGAVSMTGVDQSSPVGTPVTAGGVSTTPSATVTTAANELIVDFLVIEHTAALSVGANQTSRFSNIASSGFIKHASSTQAGADGGAMTWTNGGSTNWATIATPFKPVAAAGGNAGFLLRNMLGGGK